MLEVGYVIFSPDFASQCEVDTVIFYFGGWLHHEEAPFLGYNKDSFLLEELESVAVVVGMQQPYEGEEIAKKTVQLL